MDCLLHHKMRSPDLIGLLQHGIQHVGDYYCFSRHTFIFKYVDHMFLSSVLIRASVTY